MSEVCPGAPGRRKPHTSLSSARTSRWLGLAATPTFAIMAVLTAAGEVSAAGSLCSGGLGPIRGMVPMYVLMSVFHAAPWLKRVPGWLGHPRC
jgi:hypothetical protein